MELGLKNKVALVTGSSHGIGRAIACLLAQEGCHVIVCGRQRNRVEEVQQKIQSAGGSCSAHCVDLMVENKRQNFVNEIKNDFEKLHILVNNVGGGGRWGDTVENTPESLWMEVYEKNLLLALRFTLDFLHLMKKQNWGRVITVTSTHGKECAGRPWFNIAKTAQTVLMKSLARDRHLIRHNITFNSVAPGAIMIPDTGWEQIQKENPENFQKQLNEIFPLGRLGKPEEVAYAVVMLCSARASLINGSSILVDGGQSLCP